MLQGEIDREFAAMGTADKNGVTYFLVAQQRGEIFGFGIPGLCGGRAAVTATVVADGVESLAEGGPDIIPYCGVSDTVVNENDGFLAGAALVVVELPALNFDE
jgi:hypothetical protein